MVSVTSHSLTNCSFCPFVVMLVLCCLQRVFDIKMYQVSFDCALSAQSSFFPQKPKFCAVFLLGSFLSFPNFHQSQPRKLLVSSNQH